MNIEASTAPAVNTPAPATHVEMQAAQGSAGEVERFRDSVAWGLERGIIDRARAEQEMKAAGNSLPLPAGKHATTVPGPGDTNPETLPGFEPARATDFQLPDTAELHALTSPDGAAPLANKETMEIHAAVGGWLETAGFPAAIGSGVAKMAGDHIKEMPRWQVMEPSAQRAYQISQQAQLQKFFGAKTGEYVDLARGLVQQTEAKRPGLVAFLERTGLGNNAAFIAQVVTHARRQAAKR